MDDTSRKNLAGGRRAADQASNLTGAPPLPEWADNGLENRAPGTSIFDPVLCELVYRWFSPKGGVVLDPFAGGSVRGIVAAMLGRDYVGIDLRPEQVEANRRQWEALRPGAHHAASPSSEQYIAEPAALTPIGRVGNVQLKRDDLFALDADGLINGGKIRALLALVRQSDAKGLIASSDRNATQISRVALAARHIGLPCRIHTATGEDTPQMVIARAAGAELIQHTPGYLTVTKARAKTDAAERGWLLVPPGLEHEVSIAQTRAQCANVPTDGSVRRVMVATGSGVTLAGVVWGLRDLGLRAPIVGLCMRSTKVRDDVIKVLDRWAPTDWRDTVELKPCGVEFAVEVADNCLGDVALDPMYEAKAITHLEDGDLLWVVGIRSSSRQPRSALSASTASWIVGDSSQIESLHSAPDGVDLVFSCPPYGDLERYSDDARDLSTMERDAFLVSYRSIIRQAVARLHEDRFAVFVVGDYRDERGFYSNLVAETIGAFHAAGATLYNEAVLVTAVGSLPIRAGRQFASGRKLGKTHQNVLVFYKGDPARIRDVLGDVDVTLPEPTVDSE